jgi:serine/threonine protein kinase
MLSNMCSRCGAVLGAGVDFCPKCLLEIAIPGESDESEERLTTRAQRAARLGSPDRIDAYRILDVLGEGGMGIVYLAEQQDPIRRRVALKVIKVGMDRRQVVARFEAERQALALMDHPNIASVYDAGSTADGRPYFAMEYVPGSPITEYCDRHQLSVRDRVTLFQQVCAAVQHAHQKGVIHRDLKPSNVLVMVQDGRAVPKVIDFGVAKATHQHLTQKTLFTEHGLVIGTPEYMSPEQAALAGDDIDSTTDIYSLGVILYELLIGTLPFDSARVRRAGYDAMRQVIRDDDPPRPSTRLSGLGADAGAVARRRRTDPGTLMRELKGDLDWITLKALEKDRTRRYLSASEFAADLARHLDDEPVVARPPSSTYRAGKFVRKHRTGVMGATAALLAVSAALGGMTLLYWRTEAEARRDRLAEQAFYEWLGAGLAREPGKPVTYSYLRSARAALAARRETSSSNPVEFATHLSTYLLMQASVYWSAKPPAEIISFEREVFSELTGVVERLLREDDPRSLSFAFLVLDGDYEDRFDRGAREKFLRQCVRVARSTPAGENHLEAFQMRLADVLASDDGKVTVATDEYLARLREAWALCRDKPDSAQLEIEKKLGVALLSRALYADAEPLLLASYRREIDRLRVSPSCSPCADSAQRVADLLARLYRDWGRPEEAERYAKEAATRK